VYVCASCGKKIDNLGKFVTCPYCGNKIFRKERPPVAKKLKAE
jgi:DNA-directed RNA polymerase subunit RPC12/RpoP